jgi:hypothetical protein
VKRWIDAAQSLGDAVVLLVELVLGELSDLGLARRDVVDLVRAALP